jgi:hypothetical protein
MLLLLLPLICDAQNDSQNKARLQQLRVKNKRFKQILSSNISESKDDDIFLINFVQRNDTVFTYIGFVRKAFLADLCCGFGDLYTENPLTGYLYYNKRNCYIFGESYGLFLKKTNKTTQLPGDLSWMAHLSNIKSREDTLLPKLTLTIDGKEARYIDGMFYCDGVEYSLHIDPFLMVYAYYRGKFIPLDTFDRYPYSVIEYLEKER